MANISEIEYGICNGCGQSVTEDHECLDEPAPPQRDQRFRRCVHGIGGSGHQHGHGHCDGPQTAPILSVVRYGGHSRITYQWRGGEVSEEGPAGRTAERLAAIIERGDA